MKKLISYLLCGTFFLTPALAFAGTSKSSSDQSQKVSYLFVMRAGTAVVTKTDKGLVLTLNNTDVKTLFFSDRPVRKAGHIPTTAFMKGWMTKSSSFQKDPPNAAIVFDTMSADKNEAIHAVAVELKNPVAVGNNSWSFSMKDDSGKISIGSYDELSVFIDTLVPSPHSISGQCGGCHG